MADGTVANGAISQYQPTSANLLKMDSLTTELNGVVSGVRTA